MVAKAAINVTAYGAVGDGVANDATECQNALNAVPTAGGMVYFPRGHYLTGTTSLKIPFSGTNGFCKAALLVGDGQGTVASPGSVAGGATVIEYTGTGACIDATLPDNTAGERDTGIEGQNARWMGGIHQIALHGASAGASSVGLLTNDILDSDFYRLRTRGFQDGVRIEGDAYYSLFLKCRFTNADRDGWSMSPAQVASEGEVNATVLQSCSINNCGRYGIAMAPNQGQWLGQPFYIRDCYVEQCQSEGLHLKRCRAIYVVGGYIEFNGKSGTAGIPQIYYEADTSTGVNGNLLMVRDVYFNLSSGNLAAAAPVIAADVAGAIDNCTIHVEGCHINPKDSSTVLLKENSAWGTAINFSAIANTLLDNTKTAALTDAALMGDFATLVAINDDFAANTTFPVSGSGNRNVAFPAFAAAA